MTERIYQGQRYIAVGTIPHRRRDGTETRLIEWHSECAQCRAPFIARTPAAAKKFQPNRRCMKHKRPGQRVRGKS
jgi:hypothetical protein